jgi:hypothetical protein
LPRWVVPLPPEHPAVTPSRIRENRALNREVSRRSGFRPFPPALPHSPAPTIRIAAAGLGGWSARPDITDVGMTDTGTMDTDMTELF